MSPPRPRHRDGRPAVELLAEHNITIRGATVTYLAGHGRHAEARGRPEDTVDADWLLDDLEGTDVFDAASLLRHRAHETRTRVDGCRARVRTAARVAGPGFTQQRDTAAAITHHVLRVQAAETKLVTALDDLERGRTELAAAERSLGRFHPYGGRLVATRPVRDVLQRRVAVAAAYLDAATTIAWQAIRVLATATEHAEHLVRTVDQLVDHVLAQAAQAPPASLLLIRATLPAAERSDWWRELVSIFAESSPAERRREKRSLLLGAPRTVWTSWTSRARTGHHPAEPERDRRSDR